MQYLFIGGTNDGKRMPVDRSHVRLPIKAYDHLTYQSIRQMVEPIEYEEYRKMGFAGESEVFHVYAIATMTADEVLSAMISKYQP